MELSSIMTEINSLLPQLAGFITQFNDVVTQTGVNVITDAAGNMSIDVSSNISETLANETSHKLGIIDRLINTQGSKLNTLIEKGLSIEEQIKASNPKYGSQLTEQISTFKELNSSYKH
jgi:hypothetical protein